MTACPHCGETNEPDSSICRTCGSTLDAEKTRTDADQYRPDLLIERVAEWTQIDRIATILPGDIYPPYLLVGLLLFIDYGILQTYNYVFTGKASWITSPSNLTLMLGLVIAVVGVRYMADQYGLAIDSLKLSDRPNQPDTNRFNTLISTRTKLSVYALALLIYYTNLFFGPGIRTLVAVEGLIKFVVGQFLLAPLVNLVLVVEFTLLFIQIQFLLPRHIARLDMDLFFYDPRKMGGFGLIGQLLKRSYYVYTAGVLVYFLVAYGDTLLSAVVDDPYPEPGAQVAVFFTIAWGVGLVSILYSMYRMHQLMVQKKLKRTRQLEADLKEAIENPYDIRSSRVTEEEAINKIERQLSQVRATRTYPTTFTMWSQIAISVLLPQLLQLTVQATL